MNKDLTLYARQIAKLIKDYYLLPDNEAGGNCHIVLDDNNIDDESIIYCICECIKNNDKTGQYIMNKLLLLRKTARGKAIKLYREMP